MKLHRLFEDRCPGCKNQLTPDDIQPLKMTPYCQPCSIRIEKKQAREDGEEQNKTDREGAFGGNLLSVSKQMPDRGYDKDRGTPGWLAGEPSPGRSF